jgi:cell division protein FtsW
MGKYDKWLLSATVLLVGFGALMIYSTTSVITPNLAEKGVTEFYYFKRHIFTIAIGFSFMLIAYRLQPSFIRKMAVPLLILSFVLLVLVFIPHIGVSAGGAKRWIRIWPSTFQPSELVKISMVIFLARYMSMPEYRTDRLISFAKPIIILMPFLIAMLMQPDFGAAMSLGFLTVAMLFLSGIRMRYLASICIAAVPAVYFLIMEPYRVRRIISFLDPWKDPQGDGFQLVQSFIALGSGGITGVGLGSSQQKLAYLPESHTDFIFSIIGEEFGFIGLVVVVTLFLVLFVKGISIAYKAKDSFVYYLATGLSLMIALQALINFAVATGLLPTKGLPLPFISYGGSALLVNLAAVGILLNISKGDWITIPSASKDIVRRRRAKRILYDKKI